MSNIHRILLLIPLFWGAAGHADETPTFQSFAALPEAKLIADEFVLAAANGDPMAQIMVVSSLQASGKETLAADMLETVWREVGYAPDQVGPRPRPLRDNEGRELEIPLRALMSLYLDLAQLRLAEDAEPASLERGLRILLGNVDHGHRLSADKLGLVLSSHPRLPESHRLATRWFKLGDEGQHFSVDDLVETAEIDDSEESVAPESDQFVPCPAPLDRLPAVLAEAERAAAAIRESPDQTEAHLAAMAARITALGEDGRAPPSTMSFADFSPVAIAEMALDELGFIRDGYARVLAPWLKDVRIALEWRGMPVLLLAQLDRELGGAGFRCAEHWVRWDPGAAQTLIEPFRLFPQPVLMSAPGADGTRVHRWPGQIEFTGDLKEGRPDGRGVLRLARGPDPDQATVHEGQFRRGLLHGEGEIRTGQGAVIASGHFQYGQLHGPGRQSLLFPQHTEVEGSFEHNVLVRGNGSQTMPAAAEDAPALKYVGPFERDRPHGLGECQGEGFRYACRFQHGNFVGIGELLLVPGTASQL